MSNISFSEIEDDGVELKNGKENFELIALVDDVFFYYYNYYCAD
jgi:hypothetical protein